MYKWTVYGRFYVTTNCDGVAHTMLFKRGKKANGHATQATPMGPSYISPDLVIEGNVMSEGELHIDGTVHGTVQVNICVVESNGEVNGAINATVVYVRGKVFGPINAAEVHLYAGAHVEGDVTNEVISVEHGAHIYGAIRRSSPQNTDVEQPKANFFNQRKDEFPSLNFSQDNLNAAFDDDSFRPIKVVHPR
jgi:cytoskeletal protein CcmA (bactofilin family)